MDFLPMFDFSVCSIREYECSILTVCTIRVFNDIYTIMACYYNLREGNHVMVTYMV